MAEEKKLMCPLSFSQSDDEVYYECQEEKCAWWHILNIQTKKGRCSILTLAAALHWISVKPKLSKEET